MRCRAERDGKLEIGGRETVRVGVDEEAEREREKRINKEITWSEYIEWKLNYQIKEE